MEGSTRSKASRIPFGAWKGVGKMYSDIRNFGGVVYRDLYPGIDLECRTGKSGLQRTLVVHDKANTDGIAVTYNGVDRIRLGKDGQLEELVTDIGIIRESPIAVRFETKDGEKRNSVAVYDVSGSKKVALNITR